MNKLPDLETHMAEVHGLAAEARAASPQESTPTGKVSAPIFMGQERDIIPEKYIIHFSVTTCRHCGNVATDSEFYGLVYLRSRTMGTRVRHLVKCTRAVFNVPVEKIHTRADYIPFCFACEVIDLSHLPPPPTPANVTDFPEMRLKGQKPKDPTKEKPKAEPKKPASLDDLI